MAEKDFMGRLPNDPHSVVVDFWAPWCLPCRAIGPVVEKLSEEYAGRVDLWQVNAVKQPELLRSRRIYGIPTLIAYSLIFWAGLQFGGMTYARTMLFTSIVLHAFTRVMVVRQMDSLTIWSNRALLISYTVAVGQQVLAL